jgi:hypothetical protein
MNQKTNQQFQTQLARGRLYEVVVARWLQVARGYTTVPVFDYVGRRHGCGPRLVAPRSDGQLVRLIAPDILAFKAGLWTWFEVKLKGRAPLHRISGTRVTGLPQRHWQNYHTVRQLTHSAVWLIFVQLHEQEVVAGEIGGLIPHNINPALTMDGDGMVFFQYDQLRRLMSLDALNTFKEVHYGS